MDAVIFSREGCHLCEAVEAEIRSMKEVAVNLTVVDIDKDWALHDEYVLRIPVVLVGGKEVFEAKMMDPAGSWRGLLPRLLLAK